LISSFVCRLLRMIASFLLIGVISLFTGSIVDFYFGTLLEPPGNIQKMRSLKYFFRTVQVIQMNHQGS